MTTIDHHKNGDKKQEGDPELSPSILDIDYTPSHITKFLTVQTNDQEQYTLTEKMILDLINENKDHKEMLNERKELLEHNDKLLVMSVQQFGKIQALEKQLEEVGGHPGDIHTKQNPVFIQIPDTKVNYKHFVHIEIAKKYSDLQNSQPYNTRLIKNKERAESKERTVIVDILTTTRAEYPVTNYKGMRNTIIH